jgi:hypothetical protein
MKRLLIMLCCVAVVSVNIDAQTNPPSPGATVERLVCIRHGEKPAGGLGQLTCQGLNRALALPSVLLAKYGPPQFLFAPNPAQTISEYAGQYAYVRPLATIEPTAIYCGLPVNTQFGFPDIAGLEAELQKAAYQNATVYIAWEHLLLVTFVQDMVKACGGDPAQVPSWPSGDYDTIFVITIIRNEGQVSVVFTVDHEGLNNLSNECPLRRVGSAQVGVQTNQFGFTLIGPSDAVAVVEACTNLANPTWSRLSTNNLHGGTSYFNDPWWTNHPHRFYRLSPP